jgi:hypothetical protein
MNEQLENTCNHAFRNLIRKIVRTNNPAIVIKHNDPTVFPFFKDPNTIYYLCRVTFSDAIIPLLITETEFANNSHISTANEIEELGVGEVSRGNMSYDVIISFFGVKHTLHLSNDTFNNRLLRRISGKIECDLSQSLDNKNKAYSILTVDYWNDDFIRCVSECGDAVGHYKYFVTAQATYEDLMFMFSGDPILTTVTPIADYAELGCHITACTYFTKQYRKSKRPAWLKLYMRLIKNG